MKYLMVAVLASAITVFALQNSTPTSVRFLVWSLEGVPLATVILVSVAAGIVLAGLPLMVDRWRLRALQTRLADAEARVAERQVPPGPAHDDRVP